MKRALKVVALMSLLSLMSSPVFAQIGNLNNLLRGGVDDAELLVRAYLEPFGNGFGADLNSSWYTSAKSHGFLGFDLTVSANAAIAPESDRSFDFNALGLQNMRLAPGASQTSPTIVGEDELGPQVEVVLENNVVGSFNLPKGIGFRYVPSPMVQASVGVFDGTDVTLRFFPEVKLGDDVGRIKMFGIGAKHSLNSYLPGGDLLPIDLAVMVGITKFQAEADLDVQPESGVPGALLGNAYEFQQVDLEANSFTLGLLVSKKLAMLTLFGGVGIERSSLDIKLEGMFPITLIETQPGPTFGDPVIRNSENPVSISYTGSNSARAQVGFQLDFLLIRFYGTYTLAEYPVLSGGLGLSFR